MPTQPPPQTIRLSLRWLTFFVLIVFALGMAGGLVGARLLRPLPPLTADREQLITTVQEVTISPNKSRANLIEENQRSVVVLLEAQQTDNQQAATVGTMLSNDGLLVSTRDIPGSQLAAFDSNGAAIPINRVGTDELYGLTYYRIQDSIIPPFQLAADNPAVGDTLIALARSLTTFQPRASDWQVQEYGVPTQTTSPARQQVVLLTSTAERTLAGSPLLDEEGRIVAIIDDPAAGTAIPINELRLSLNRVTTNQRESNPFEFWGLQLAYQFRFNESQTQRGFAAIVTGIAGGSPAAIAGLRIGDNIKQINGNNVAWTASIVEQLSNQAEVNLVITRQEQTSSLILRAPNN
jgi:S1-C subfamily serine protease